MENLLIAVDLQNDFMNKDGALYVPDSEEIKETINSVVNILDNIVDYKLYTMDLHTENDPEFSDNPDFVNTFPPHCIIGTEGSKLISQAHGVDKNNDIRNVLSNVKIFYKDKFSVFEGNREFLETLKNHANIDNIYIFGVAGDVCVKAVIDGLIEHKDKDISFNKLNIITDAIASIDPSAFTDYCVELYIRYDYINLIVSDSLTSMDIN